ncbi:classical arabinogalactan protein 9 [Triticum aestivum]|uniref:classical arabinogalactan protein 9 n=1 Tax=Triticum aestivum TaxID=4565 RepID=UPI001D033BCF|nr:classical arabinogalactan protein 9-like [Triticum aestivum]
MWDWEAQPTTPPLPPHATGDRERVWRPPAAVTAPRQRAVHPQAPLSDKSNPSRPSLPWKNPSPIFLPPRAFASSPRQAEPPSPLSSSSACFPTTPSPASLSRRSATLLSFHYGDALELGAPTSNGSRGLRPRDPTSFVVRRRFPPLRSTSDLPDLAIELATPRPLLMSL